MLNHASRARSAAGMQQDFLITIGRFQRYKIRLTHVTIVSNPAGSVKPGTALMLIDEVIWKNDTWSCQLSFLKAIGIKSIRSEAIMAVFDILSAQ